MRLLTVGEVIAKRVLHLREENGQKRDVLVLMGKPVPFPEPEEGYYCPIQIVGIGDEKVRYVGGVDAFQAIDLAFKMIGIKLHVELVNHKPRLTWFADDKGGLGFPAP